MVKDYKRYAINKFFIELYCSDPEQKYIGKNRDLIERAQFAGDKWRKTKETYDRNMAKMMESM